MSNELLIVLITGLTILTNGIQFWYWSKVCATLIDKVMCKNYGEYVQTKELEKSLSIPSGRKPFSAPLEELTEAENDHILNELNGLLR